MKLYYNPLSSYSQKTLTALYEKNVPFTGEIVNLMDPAARAGYQRRHPLGKVSLLVLDDGEQIPESSIIIEYLDARFTTGARLIPDDADLARQTRLFDRYFDLYMNDPMQAVFFDGLKPESDREPRRVAAAKARLDQMYAMIDGTMARRTWANGRDFSMADCAAAPTLQFLRMVHPFDGYENLAAYANRLAERPSYARVWTEAQPFIAAFAGVK